MADVNIQMKQKSGESWDNLYPVTKADNVTETSTKKFVSDAQISAWNGKQDALGFTPEDSANKGQPNGYASLDAEGKVHTGQIPALAITDVFEADDEEEMLDLDIQQGDICVRNDESKTYINVTGDNDSMADWVLLKTPAGSIASVNGQTGPVVTLSAADVGAEPAITKKSGFNLDKSDAVDSDSSNTLATSKAVKIAKDTADSKASIKVSATEPNSDFWFEIVS